MVPPLQHSNLQLFAPLVDGASTSASERYVLLLSHFNPMNWLCLFIVFSGQVSNIDGRSKGKRQQKKLRKRDRVCLNAMTPATVVLRRLVPRGSMRGIWYYRMHASGDVGGGCCGSSEGLRCSPFPRPFAYWCAVVVP